MNIYICARLYAYAYLCMTLCMLWLTSLVYICSTCKVHVWEREGRAPIYIFYIHLYVIHTLCQQCVYTMYTRTNKVLVCAHPCKLSLYGAVCSHILVSYIAKYVWCEWCPQVLFRQNMTLYILNRPLLMEHLRYTIQAIHQLALVVSMLQW